MNTTRQYRRRYTVKERLLRKVQIASSGCWEWQGYKMRGGYGKIGVEKDVRLAHRVAYELFVGPVPEGLDLDHLCRNTSCVNPAHLEPVTRLENLRRGVGTVGKTHCTRGHELIDANVRLIQRTSGGSAFILRVCRKCHAIRNLAAYHRKAARA